MYNLLGDKNGVPYTVDAVNSERFRRIRDTLERIVQVRRNLARWENLDTYLDSIIRVGDRRTTRDLVNSVVFISMHDPGKSAHA